MTWSPNGREFIVVYGTMPSKSTLFDHRAQPVFDFGPASRNTVKYNGRGRLLYLGGFGNLTGEVVNTFNLCNYLKMNHHLKK